MLFWPAAFSWAPQSNDQLVCCHRSITPVITRCCCLPEVNLLPQSSQQKSRPHLQWCRKDLQNFLVLIPSCFSGLRQKLSKSLDLSNAPTREIADHVSKSSGQMFTTTDIRNRINKYNSEIHGDENDIDDFLMTLSKMVAMLLPNMTRTREFELHLPMWLAKLK